MLQLLENEESSSLKFPLTTVQVQIQNIYNGKWFWNLRSMGQFCLDRYWKLIHNSGRKLNCHDSRLTQCPKFLKVD